jgi:hypothetical protein
MKEATWFWRNGRIPEMAAQQKILEVGFEGSQE